MGGLWTIMDRYCMDVYGEVSKCFSGRLCHVSDWHAMYHRKWLFSFVRRLPEMQYTPAGMM